jgi:hypothetical protein
VGESFQRWSGLHSHRGRRHQRSSTGPCGQLKRSELIMELEEAQAWIAPTQMTEDEVTLVRLLVKGVVDYGRRNILVANGSTIAKTPQMDIKIPRSQAKNRGWPDDQDFTLREFCLRSKDLELNDTIFQVCARDYRADGSIDLVNAMTAEAMMIWINEIATFGIKLEDIMDAETAKPYWESESV